MLDMASTQRCTSRPQPFTPFTSRLSKGCLAARRDAANPAHSWVSADASHLGSVSWQGKHSKDSNWIVRILLKKRNCPAAVDHERRLIQPHPCLSQSLKLLSIVKDALWQNGIIVMSKPLPHELWCPLFYQIRMSLCQIFADFRVPGEAVQNLCSLQWPVLFKFKSILQWNKSAQMRHRMKYPKVGCLLVYLSLEQSSSDDETSARSNQNEVAMSFARNGWIINEQRQLFHCCAWH